ncbi:MAG: hypothetical protein HQM08_19430 [Candidatus Riflebacteria bacterium]|nr:hypothetical protein [Candidatus Riflebacteria bacterium]
MIKRVEGKIREKKQIAGKTIHFSTDPGMGSKEIVSLYRSRCKVEATFKLEKDPDGVPFRPMHCWTDSKIRVHGFICVLALLIWGVMQYRLRQVGLRMSDLVLRKELEDMKEVTMLYSPSRVAKVISDNSTVQKEFASHLGLYRYFPKGYKCLKIGLTIQTTIPSNSDGMVIPLVQNFLLAKVKF